MIPDYLTSADAIPTSFAAARRNGVLVLSGDIDAASTVRFTAALTTALADGIRDIDLGAVHFLGTTALRALLDAALQPLTQRGEYLTLHHPNRAVRRVLEVAGFPDDTLRITP